jgi:hypothetical protein
MPTTKYVPLNDSQKTPAQLAALGQQPQGASTGPSAVDDTGVETFGVARATGITHVGEPISALGELYLNQLTGYLSTAPVQFSHVTKNMIVRLSQYSNTVKTNAIAFFRSRGASQGTKAACVDGDSLLNLTAVGVTGNGTDTPLAALITAIIPVGGTFPQSLSPDFAFELAKDTINSHRPVWKMIGMTGHLVMGQAGEEIQIKEGANSMQGVAVSGGGGGVVVANTLITANTRIALTAQDGGLAPGGPVIVTARTPGADFTINAGGTAGVNVFWQLWEPAP